MKRAIWITGCCVALATPVHADTTPLPEERAQGVQDIVVTAQRRSERLKDVAISAVVSSGDALASRNIGDVSGLTAIVPGLTAAERLMAPWC
jgi:iron complex outermembrane receptor protein